MTTRRNKVKEEKVELDIAEQRKTENRENRENQKNK